MSDLKHYKRLAELWENNASFYLKEIERANWLYQELLKKNELLEKSNKELKMANNASELKPIKDQAEAKKPTKRVEVFFIDGTSVVKTNVRWINSESKLIQIQAVDSEVWYRADEIKSIFVTKE